MLVDGWVQCHPPAQAYGETPEAYDGTSAPALIIFLFSQDNVEGIDNNYKKH
jgi:hypothetical protein